MLIIGDLGGGIVRGLVFYGKVCVVGHASILPSRLREGLGEGMFVGWVAVTGPPQTPPASGRGLTRLARLISCNAPRTEPFTTPQCGCTLQLPSSENSWRHPATQAVRAIDRKSREEGRRGPGRVSLGGQSFMKKK